MSRAWRQNNTSLNTFYPRVLGTQCAVATENYLATKAGADLLGIGGNAVDAAVGVCHAGKTHSRSDGPAAIGGAIITDSGASRRTLSHSAPRWPRSGGVDLGRCGLRKKDNVVRNRATITICTDKSSTSLRRGSGKLLGWISSCEP